MISCRGETSHLPPNGIFFLPGVSIDEDTLVRAGSVVTRDRRPGGNCVWQPGESPGDRGATVMPLRDSRRG